MTIRSGWSALACALAMLSMCAAQAAKKNEDAGEPAKRMLARMDQNGDGMISSEEFRNAMMRRFANADLDHDGKLQGDEIPARSIVAADGMDSADGVTMDAFSGSLQSVFASFDTDNDGMLAGSEIEAFAQARRHMQEGKP